MEVVVDFVEDTEQDIEVALVLDNFDILKVEFNFIKNCNYLFSFRNIWMILKMYTQNVLKKYVPSENKDYQIDFQLQNKY